MMDARVIGEKRAELQNNLKDLFEKREKGEMKEEKFRDEIAFQLEVCTWSDFPARKDGGTWVAFDGYDKFTCYGYRRPATEEEIRNTLEPAEALHIPEAFLEVVPAALESPMSTWLRTEDGGRYYRLASRDAELNRCFPDRLRAGDHVSLELRNGCGAELEISEVQEVNDQNRKLIWFEAEELGVEEDWIWYLCSGTMKGYTDERKQEIRVLKSKKDSRMALIWEQTRENTDAMKEHWSGYYNFLRKMNEDRAEAVLAVIPELEKEWKAGYPEA